MVFLCVSTHVHAFPESHGQVNVLGRVRPTAEPHVTFLIVEREVGDVNGAGTLQLLMWRPDDGAIVENQGLGVVRRGFCFRTVKHVSYSVTYVIYVVEVHMLCNGM